MDRKILWFSATAGSIIGGIVGTILDKGNGFGIWSLFLSTVGGIAGIIMGYRLGDS